MATKKIVAQDINNRIFVKSTAWVIIILSVFALYYLIFIVFQIEWIARQFVDVRAGLEGLNHPPSKKAPMMPSSPMQIIDIARIVLYILVGTGINSLVAGIGLQKVKNWGRILFSAMAILNTLLVVAVIVYFTLSINEYMPEFILEEGLNNLFKTNYLYYEVLLLLICWLLIRTTIKLNTRNMRQHFKQKTAW